MSVQWLLGQWLHRRRLWYPCWVTRKSTISLIAHLDTAAAPIPLNFPEHNMVELQWQRLSWTSARTSILQPRKHMVFTICSMQYNWYNNLIYGSWCGLSSLALLLNIAYSENLQGDLSLVVILENLSSNTHFFGSKKMRLMIRTHLSPGNALGAPTLVQQ